MGAYAIPIAMGAMSAISSFGQSMSAQSQARSQAAGMEQQADLMRKQAEFATQKGEIEARAIERQKREIRRKFEAIQGKNRAMLGASNVDMTSGSPLDISIGNINRFAEDMGENAYEAALKRWEADTQRKNLEYQAAMYDARADSLSQSQGNLLTSLLGAGMAGASSFFSGGMMTGAFTEAPNAGVNTVANTVANMPRTSGNSFNVGAAGSRSLMIFGR